MITKISNEVIAELAASSSYKERFIAEYIQLKQRWEKLKVFNTKIRAAKLTKDMNNGVDEPLHDCPASLLADQQHVMGQYLSILETRAAIEDIDFKETIEALARETICRQSEVCEAKCCCQSEGVPPCEEGACDGIPVPKEGSDDLIMSREDTLRVFECCSRYLDGDEGICRLCPLCDPESTECGGLSALVKSGAHYMRMLEEEYC